MKNAVPNTIGQHTVVFTNDLMYSDLNEVLYSIAASLEWKGKAKRDMITENLRPDKKPSANLVDGCRLWS